MPIPDESLKSVARMSTSSDSSDRQVTRGRLESLRTGIVYAAGHYDSNRITGYHRFDRNRDSASNSVRLGDALIAALLIMAAGSAPAGGAGGRM